MPCELRVRLARGHGWVNCFHRTGKVPHLVGMPDEHGFTPAVEQVRHHFEFRSLPKVISVDLFGSEGRGRAHRESDVDVAVLLDRSRAPRAEDRAEHRVRLGADLDPFLRKMRRTKLEALRS